MIELRVNLSLMKLFIESKDQMLIIYHNEGLFSSQHFSLSFSQLFY